MPSYFDIKAWLAENVPEPVDSPAINATGTNGTAPNGHIRKGKGTGRPDPAERAAAYLGGLPPAVAGQGGHDQTFDAACALVKGFDLSPTAALPILETYNARCQPPWTTAELIHKLADADAKPDKEPRGYLRDKDSEGYRPPRGGMNGHAGPAVGNTGDDVHVPAGSEDNPHRLARLIVADRYSHPDGIALRFWREDFHAWDGCAYRRIPRKEMAAEVTRALAGEFERLYMKALMSYGMAMQRRGDGGGEKPTLPKPRPVTTRLVGDVLQALTDLALLREKDCGDQPAWLIPNPPWPAEEMLSATNGLVHLPSFVAGLPYFLNPTPTFFAPCSLNYDFDPDAPEPTQWLAFLHQLWGDDTETIECLQEWMGYLLTPNTSLEKIGMLIGPPRAGKGTIVRIIKAIVGSVNVASPTLASLASNFGLSPLVGKSVAIIEDARLSGRVDIAVIVERLLDISGRGSQSIDRKYKEQIKTELMTRFLIVSNELPKMKDESGALASRLIIIKFYKTFLGVEDTKLSEKLEAELPGILLWAIKGWARLHKRGKFIPPAASVDLLETMEALTSPIKTFIRDRCFVAPKEREPVGDVYLAWRTWCAARGFDHPGSEEDFGRNLRAALPDIRRTHPRIEHKPVWCYEGLRLLTDVEREDNRYMSDVLPPAKQAPEPGSDNCDPPF